MADDVTKWELFLTPKHFMIFETKGQYWIQSNDNMEQAVPLVDYIKKVTQGDDYPVNHPIV